MRISAFLVLFFVSAGAAAQTPAPDHGATQTNLPAGSSALPVDRNTPPEPTAPLDCLPIYPPPAAWRLNESGRTLMRVHVTAKGTVTDVAVKSSSGHDALDAAAVRCAQTRSYRPATQNGVAIDGYADLSLCFSLEPGICPLPAPFDPPGSPAGWEHERVGPNMSGGGGVIVSYKLPQSPGAEQYLSGAAYPNFSALSDFVTKNDANLQGINGLHIQTEEQTTACDGEPASEIEYSQSGLIHNNPFGVLDVQQVRTVRAGWAYVTTYIRPDGSPKRSDAEQWIRSCGSRG